MNDVSLSAILLALIVLAVLIAVIKPVLLFVALCLALYALYRSVLVLIASAQRLKD